MDIVKAKLNCGCVISVSSSLSEMMKKYPRQDGWYRALPCTEHGRYRAVVSVTEGGVEIHVAG